MSDDIEKTLSEAPVGMITHGTFALHKVIDNKGRQRIFVVSEIGDSTSRMEVQPVFIKALSGKGPLGKIAAKLFGATAIEKGDGGVRSLEQ